MNKKQAAELVKKYPNHFRDMAIKSQQSWVEGGRKPRGFAARRDIASQAGKKSKKAKK